MHYFKNYFNNNKKSETSINGENYELMMKDNEFKEFIEQFTHKVNNVIDYRIREMERKGLKEEIVGVSIYPVPSTSNFNRSMADIMSRFNLCSLPSQVIDTHLLSKDLRNLEKDTDFIEKNKEYYNGGMSNVDKVSVDKYLDSNLNRNSALQKLNKYIERMNFYVREILRYYYSYKQNGSDKTLMKIGNFYKEYYELWVRCQKEAEYDDVARGKRTKIQKDFIASPIKYSKGPSIEGRSKKIWGLVKNIFRGKVCEIDGKSYEMMSIQTWKPNDFQIKTLSNGERMGLRNIYNPNKDYELVKRELEKIKGTVFVIFDDNISGGSTLSDIFYQCKRLEIDKIIPITFGQMKEKWQRGGLVYNKPTNDKGEYGKFNF